MQSPSMVSIEAALIYYAAEAELEAIRAYSAEGLRCCVLVLMRLDEIENKGFQPNRHRLVQKVSISAGTAVKEIMVYMTKVEEYEAYYARIDDKVWLLHAAVIHNQHARDQALMVNEARVGEIMSINMCD